MSNNYLLLFNSPLPLQREARVSQESSKALSDPTCYWDTSQTCVVLWWEIQVQGIAM